MLSREEQQVWEDIQRFYDDEVEEPARGGGHRTWQRRRAAPGLEEMPAAAVAGVWITIFLVIFGAAGAGLAVGAATALGWLLWRWWEQLDGAGSAPEFPRHGDAQGAPGVPGGSSITSWQRRLRRIPEEEDPRDW